MQRDIMKSKLPPLPSKPVGQASRFSSLVPKRNVKDYSPSSWKGYFDKQHDVNVGDNTFRLYTRGTDGPVILLLHGGGHSALSWAVFTKTLCDMCDCQVAAIDFRGHGDSSTTNDTNMAADVMAYDICHVILNFYDQSPPPIVMMGHSMGGAIAVHIAAKKILPNLSGLAVIDVVEGTALDALSSMQSFLRSRPQKFGSLKQAIEWSIRSGQLRNLTSAKISMAGQLKKVEGTSGQPSNVSLDIVEETEEEVENEQTSLSSTSISEEQSEYTWRVDLAETEKYWKGWFENMSSLFLSCPVPKLLLLAGIDRLDKDLTIGQMQGKFQMQVLPNCGHMVHEDVPDKVAEILTAFLLRQKLTVAKSNFERHTPSC